MTGDTKYFVFKKNIKKKVDNATFNDTLS